MTVKSNRPLKPSANLAFVVVGLALFLLPYAGVTPFLLSFMFLLFQWIIIASSWNILTGYSGYFSFGHVAFFGAGAFTTAILTFFYEMSFFLALPVAGGVAAALAAGLGFVVFRLRKLRGEFFALTTLAVTFLIFIIVVNVWGAGIVMPAIKAFPPFNNVQHVLYTTALIVMMGMVFVAYKIYNSKFGLNLFAIREDEDAAEALGINSFNCKLAVFSISSFFAGVSGGIFAGWIRYIWPESVFPITISLFAILMSILGGTSHWVGPIIGAVIIAVLLQALAGGATAIVNNIILGLLLIVFIIFMPQGIYGLVTQRAGRPLVGLFSGLSLQERRPD